MGLIGTEDDEESGTGIKDVVTIRDTWVDPAEAVPEKAPIPGRGQHLGVEELSELHSGIHRTCIALLEMLRWIEPATHQELQTHRDHVYAHETYLQAHQTQLQLQSTLIQTQHQVHETRFQMQHAELAALRETDRRRQDQMVETLRVIRDIRREMGDMHAELLHCESSRGELDSQDQWGWGRIEPDHQEASSGRRQSL
ncbi:hypothetical protein Tco_0824637 [Tanacetum coccineum]|uniref:Uncharacterized protein n=1 Tax=Tanacetum coccineum TaxID=301880 RepID=A0ABQ5AQM8_9ASTR